MQISSLVLSAETFTKHGSFSSLIFSTINDLKMEEKLISNTSIHVILLFILMLIELMSFSWYCVKSVRTRSFSGPYFPAFRLNISEYGHFSRSVTCLVPFAWVFQELLIDFENYTSNWTVAYQTLSNKNIMLIQLQAWFWTSKSERFNKLAFETVIIKNTEFRLFYV